MVAPSSSTWAFRPPTRRVTDSGFTPICLLRRRTAFVQPQPLVVVAPLHFSILWRSGSPVSMARSFLDEGPIIEPARGCHGPPSAQFQGKGLLSIEAWGQTEIPERPAANFVGTGYYQPLTPSPSPYRDSSLTRSVQAESSFKPKAKAIESIVVGGIAARLWMPLLVP